jgi:hypothetical protein
MEGIWINRNLIKYKPSTVHSAKQSIQSYKLATVRKEFADIVIKDK